MPERASKPSGERVTPAPEAVVRLSEEEWRRRLSPEQYRVLREGATDTPFAGRYTHPGADGRYLCAGCGAELFDSADQFDSGCGWPSFTAPTAEVAVTLVQDFSLGMRRTEVRCRACGGHLGHVFDDGPGPTGARWCINSSSLDLSDRIAESSQAAPAHEAAAVEGGT